MNELTMSVSPEKIVGPNLLDILEKVQNGQRLSREDGIRLYIEPNLTAVGYLANIMREAKHGDKTFYVRNQHINYTNICNKGCKFCSFYAKKGGPEPYEMSLEDVRDRLDRHKNVEITEVHMVGGINPRLPYQYYIDLVSLVKNSRPGVHVKAFTAVEIVEIARVGGVSIEQTLTDLMQAGLDSLPGGGIEILSDRVHRELFGRQTQRRRVEDGGAHRREAWPKPICNDALRPHRDNRGARRSPHSVAGELQDETNHFFTMTPLCFHPEGTGLSANCPCPPQTTTSGTSPSLA